MINKVYFKFLKLNNTKLYIVYFGKFSERFYRKETCRKINK